MPHNVGQIGSAVVRPLEDFAVSAFDGLSVRAELRHVRGVDKAQGCVQVDADSGGKPPANVDEIREFLGEVFAVVVEDVLAFSAFGVLEEVFHSFPELFRFFFNELQAEPDAFKVFPTLADGLFHRGHELGEHGEMIVIVLVPHSGLPPFAFC